MSRFYSGRVLLAGSVFALVSLLSREAAAQPNYVPDLQSGPDGWQHPFGGTFPAVQGSAPPVTQDPRYPFVNPVESFRIGDLRNPNLMPWARDIMQKDNDDIVVGGQMQFTANSSCRPAGVPMFMLGAGPIFILQAPEEVLMMEEQGQQVRHIRLNATHSANPKPSYYGESIGWYEGDTLVVDTVGVRRDVVLDAYRTPHTGKLHVVERWRRIDDGRGLRVDITVEDPDTFYQPWRTYQRYQRGQRPLAEFICAENNMHLFDYQMPEAEKPDF